MAEFPSLSGALMLSSQISTDRLLDSFRRARETSALQLNDISWRNAYNNLANRHNDLAHCYNALLDAVDKLCRSHDRALEAMDDIVAAERTMKESAEAQNKRLRERLEAVEFERSMLERYIRHHKPEYYELRDLI